MSLVKGEVKGEVKRNDVMAPKVALKMALKMAPKMALKVAPKMILKVILKWYPRINIWHPVQFCIFLKTKLGSLLITSKLPLMYERRILVLLLKSYIQYILCIYVYMYSRIHEYTFQPISARQRLWNGLPHSPHICLYRLSCRLWSGFYLHLAWWVPWL